jgi:hypothetical protein
MIVLTATAKLFSQRPSSLLGVSDPVLALAIDLAAAERALELQSSEHQGPVEQICL